MRQFTVLYTGDYLDEAGKPVFADLALDLYEPAPWVRVDFLRDQAPTPGDCSYWDHLYSLEVAPHHVDAGNAIGKLTRRSPMPAADRSARFLSMTCAAPPESIRSL